MIGKMLIIKIKIIKNKKKKNSMHMHTQRKTFRREKNKNNCKNVVLVQFLKIILARGHSLMMCVFLGVSFFFCSFFEEYMILIYPEH